MSGAGGLTTEECYRAIVARDARFDGRFFTAVTTTKIYCRPICPARTPKPGHVRFYPSAAAAESAGFRACRRCRPNACPGTAAWMGTSAVVARAMRLVSEGALDDADVDTLAARVGLGERQLRRLFSRHLGASPRAVAESRRAHFAAELVQRTSLPMTEIAHAAGYASIRRFNEAFRRAFDATPSELRARGGAAAAEGLVFAVPVRAPFDGAAMLAYFAAREVPALEHITPTTLRRAVELDGDAGVLELRLAHASNGAGPNGAASSGAGAVTARLFGGPPSRALVVAERVRTLLDADADPVAVRACLGADPALRARCRTRPGVRIPGAWDGFEIAARAVLGQQASVRAAATLVDRLVRRLGRPLGAALDAHFDDAAPPRFCFPSAAAVAAFDGPDAAGALGVPRSRLSALSGVAREVAEGRLALDGSEEPQALREKLGALPGIGPWTAEYVALRAGRDPDAFPASDLGLRRALSDGGAPLSARALAAHAEAWRPFRGYAAMLLWQTGEEGHRAARRDG